MDKKMVIDTKLGIVKYMSVVNEISSAYFNEDGDYQPQIGLLNAMTSFFNNCVTESKFDDEFNHDIDDPFDIEKIIMDDDFVEAFNDAIIVRCIQLDYANAFRDALDIVNTNKVSINHAIMKLKKLINGIADSFSSVLTPETIELVEKLKELMEGGEFTVDKFMESYGDSQMFQQLLASKEKDKV